MAPSSTVYFKHQRYNKIRKTLLSKGELFTDPEFPPTTKSVYPSRSDNDIIWKRPTDLCKVPKLVIQGATTDDLVEGTMGNKWFVTACSSLVVHKELFNKVLPEVTKQEYDMLSYTGLFRFRFWVFGEWTEVVVDDYLPTKHGQLIFCHSRSKNEFWSALMEKAYAKLFGDYESMAMRCSCVDALVDFTGGVAECLQDLPEKADTREASLLKQITSALENHSIVVCEIREDGRSTNNNLSDDVSIIPLSNTSSVDTSAEIMVLDQQNRTKREETGGSPSTRPTKTGYFRSGSVLRDSYITEQGLLKSHGYIVTKVARARISRDGSKDVTLIRLRSPFQAGDWIGPWSNNSSEMLNLRVQERTKLGLDFDSECEFWMPFSSFLRLFSHLDFCHLINTSVFSLKKTWTETLLPGIWETAANPHDDRSGGNWEQTTLLCNPQFMFDVTGSQPQPEVIVSLEQNDRAASRHGADNSQHLAIGFSLLKVEENRKYRLHRVDDVIAHSSYSNTRSIFHRTPLYKGRYVIVPSTKEPRLRGEFIIRLYNTSKDNLRELVKHEPSKSALICVSAPLLVVQITVIRAEGLSLETGSLNPVCTVKCEGESLRTPISKDTDSPEWNTSFIFYKKGKETKDDIRLQVHSSQTWSNTLIGETTLKEYGDVNGRTLELPLYQKAKKKQEVDVELPSRLHVLVRSSENLSEF